MRVVSPPIGGVLLPGIIAVESTTGKYYLAGPQANASGMIRRYGVITGTVTNTLTTNVTFARPWVRVSRSGSSIVTYLSADGKSWSPLAWDTVALTTAFTAAPDRVGIGLFSSQANSRLLFSTDYWIQSF
jgi:hypothetical protein